MQRINRPENKDTVRSFTVLRVYKQSAWEGMAGCMQQEAKRVGD